MSPVVMWVNLTDLNSVSTIPVLVMGGQISWHALQYFLCAKHRARSISWRTTRASAIRALAQACQAGAGDPSDPWRWRLGTELLHQRGADRDAAAILRSACDFIVFLVVSGVRPPTGAGLAAIMDAARARCRSAGPRADNSMLAHVLVAAGSVDPGVPQAGVGDSR